MIGGGCMWGWGSMDMPCLGVDTMPLCLLQTSARQVCGSPLCILLRGCGVNLGVLRCDVASAWVVRIMSEVPIPSCRHFISHPFVSVGGRVHIGCEFSNGFFIVRSGVAMSIWHC